MLPARRRAALWLLALGRLLGSLDALPLTFGGTCFPRHRIAEHVRMAADHLARHRFDDVAKCERAFLFRHACVIDDLQQEVAELVTKIGRVATLDRVPHLVGFFDRVGRDGRERLFEIPGAAGDGSA